MTKLGAIMRVNFFAVSIIFLNIIFFSPSESLSDTYTWNNIVERKDIFYKKFTNTPFNGKIETYWPNGNLKETGLLRMAKRIIYGNITMKMETPRKLNSSLMDY